MSQTTVMVALLVLTVSCEVVPTASVTCKDTNGNDVDWYYVYKLPKNSSTRNPLIKKGVAFYYLDNSQQTFQLSNISMEQNTQPVGQTLKQIYDQPQMIAHIMYNDQPPDDTPKPSRGHTKGVLAFNDSNGFWLIHSIPKFPKRDRYEWNSSSSVNGQSILCVSFKSSEMEKIAQQMLYNYPYVYANSLPSELGHIAPTLKKVINGTHVSSPPWNHTAFLQSRGGQKFTHYAKYNSYGKDLYLDLVAQDIKSNLLVETWQRSGPLPSSCSFGHCVQNIRAVRFPSTEFSYTKDHSKWAVSDDRKKVICVGDINRESSQFK